MQIFRKVLQLIAYYLLPLTLLALAFLRTEAATFAQFGSLALLLLIFIVFIKPIAVIARQKLLWKFISLRRELGIANFWLFFFHFAGLYYIYNMTPSRLFDTSYFVFWGALAGIGMVILAATANNFSTKLLKRNWKRLHYITYLIFLLALYHGSKAEKEIEKFYIVGSIFIVLKIIEYLIHHKKRKNKNPA